MLGRAFKVRTGGFSVAAHLESGSIDDRADDRATARSDGHGCENEEERAARPYLGEQLNKVGTTGLSRPRLV